MDYGLTSPVFWTCTENQNNYKDKSYTCYVYATSSTMNINRAAIRRKMLHIFEACHNLSAPWTSFADPRLMLRYGLS